MAVPNAEITRLGYTTEIATRQRSWDYTGWDIKIPDGDLVMLKKGYDTYNWLNTLRFVLTDAHVGACYESRKAGTLSREWEVLEPETGGGKRVNTRALRVIEEWVKTAPIRQAISDLLDAPFFGMAAVEVVWGVQEGLWLPEKLVGKPAEWFVFGSEKQDLRFLGQADMIRGEELPDRRFLLAQHHPTYQNPYGTRLLSKCYWPVTFKRSGLKFWAIFTEKFGMPWVTGKVPRGTPEEERAETLAKLAAMVQDAVAVVNDDESVAVVSDSNRTSSADIYHALVAESDRQISKAILGQTLTTETGESGGGSYALGKVHGDVRDDLLEQDQRMVAQAMDTLFGWITELNFAAAAAPRWGWYEEEDVQKERADRDKVLTDAGVKFSRKYWEMAYNLESDWIEDEPEPVALPQQIPGQPGSGQPGTGQEPPPDQDGETPPPEFADPEKKKTATPPTSHRSSLWS